MPLLPQQPHTGAWWNPLIRPCDQVHIFAFPRSLDLGYLKDRLQRMRAASCSSKETSHTLTSENGCAASALDDRWESISPRQEVLLPESSVAPWFAIIHPLPTQVEGKVIAGFHKCCGATSHTCSLTGFSEENSARLTTNFLEFQVDSPLCNDDERRELIRAAWYASLQSSLSNGSCSASPKAPTQGECNGVPAAHNAEAYMAGDDRTMVMDCGLPSDFEHFAELRSLQRQGYYPRQMALQYTADDANVTFQCSWDPKSVKVAAARACVADFKQRISAMVAERNAEAAETLKPVNGLESNERSDPHSMRNAASEDATTGTENAESLTESDISTILTYNQRIVPPAELSIAFIIHQNAARYPDAAAIDSWDLSVTYKGLDEKSAALAEYLYQHFGASDQPILTLFDKSAIGAIAKLAILRSGNHYVPVDPAHPLERKKMIADKADCGIVLCNASHAVRARELHLAKTIVVDSAFIDECCGSAAYSSIDHSRLHGTCAILFTSGSTGTPKGVRLGHKAISTSLQDQGTTLGVRPGSRVLSFASFAFDAHMWDTWVPLLMGATSCIPGGDERMDNLQAFLVNARITIGLLFPAALSVLDPSTLPTLERFYVGGEPVSGAQVALWAQSGKILGNLYGPTECSVICSANLQLQQDDPSDVGKPIGGQCWITDPNDVDRMLPPGTAGELVVSGSSLAEHYVGDAGKTQEAFVTPTWPSWAPKVSRAYRTGDLAVLGNDGIMRIKGRKDDQIKLYGHRIERKELEFGIAKCNLHEASPVVEKVEDKETGRQQLLCFFVPGGVSAPGLCTVLGRNEQLDDLEAELRKRLLDIVPKAWIPHSFVFVTSLPLNTSDKIDRRRLREMHDSIATQQSEQQIAAEPAPASSQTESILREVWSKVLGLSAARIDSTLDFTAMGGSSIDAIKVVAQCRQRNLNLTTSDIFAHPVLADLVARCDPKEAGGPTEDEIPRVKTPEPFELL